METIKVVKPRGLEVEDITRPWGSYKIGCKVVKFLKAFTLELVIVGAIVNGLNHFNLIGVVYAIIGSCLFVIMLSVLPFYKREEVNSLTWDKYEKYDFDSYIIGRAIFFLFCGACIAFSFYNVYSSVVLEAPIRGITLFYISFLLLGWFNGFMFASKPFSDERRH